MSCRVSDMDPLSLLCRLATSVPPPPYHTVKYAGVLAPASSWRSRVVPPRAPADTAETPESLPKAPKRAGTYRPWAELRRRAFGIDVLGCPKCAGPMKLLALITHRGPHGGAASPARKIAAVAPFRRRIG